MESKDFFEYWNQEYGSVVQKESDVVAVLLRKF